MDVGFRASVICSMNTKSVNFQKHRQVTFHWCIVTFVLIASSIGVCEVDMVDSGLRSADCTAFRSIKRAAGFYVMGTTSSRPENSCQTSESSNTNGELDY